MLPGPSNKKTLSYFVNCPEHLENTVQRKGTQQTFADEEFHPFNGEYVGDPKRDFEFVDKFTP